MKEVFRLAEAEQGIQCNGVGQVNRVSRPRECGGTLGFMKVLVDARTKRILGDLKPRT